MISVVSTVHRRQHKVWEFILCPQRLGVQDVRKHFRAVEIVAVGDAQPLALRLGLHETKRLVGRRVARVAHRVLQTNTHKECKKIMWDEKLHSLLFSVMSAYRRSELLVDGQELQSDVSKGLENFLQLTIERLVVRYEEVSLPVRTGLTQQACRSDGKL